jgi:flagellar basal body-associated protein FliL
MEQSQKTSRRMLYVGLVAVVVVIIAVIIGALAMLGTSKKEVATSTNTAVAPQIASKDDVKQSLAQLDTTMKQAATDPAAAKAAIKDGTNQIKVGN